MTHRYKCGCPIGTPSVWRNALGKFVYTGSLNAVTYQCLGCGKLLKLDKDMKSITESNTQ